MILYTAYFTTVDKEKDNAILDEHLKYIYKLLDDKVIVAKGPFTDHSGGLIIYKAKDMDEALGYINSDPVIKEASRSVEVKEWKSTIEA
ncbi:MAG: YciI family protein [Acidaminobacteraceae bacterium]